ncbi:MAG: hypothetical protein Q7J15_08065 [Candidatus Desulfaltia sp.]|nr:hypothetical protein [Candidatus Desulfaltia sp.]
MNLGELETELTLYIQDDSLAANFKTWINNAVYEIANDFFLPALRLNEPVGLIVTKSNWLYDLPATYMKKVFKCYDSNWNKATLKRSLDDLDELDIDHDDIGDHVTHIATRDTKIGIYPMAGETIKLWFYKKPTALVHNLDELVCIPAQYHSRVVISKIIIKAYHLLMDLSSQPPHQSLQWWIANYSAGLYGSPGGDIGMLNCFARDKKIKRTGGRDPMP